MLSLSPAKGANDTPHMLNEADVYNVTWTHTIENAQKNISFNRNRIEFRKSECVNEQTNKRKLFEF